MACIYMTILWDPAQNISLTGIASNRAPSPQNTTIAMLRKIYLTATSWAWLNFVTTVANQHLFYYQRKCRNLSPEEFTLCCSLRHERTGHRKFIKTRVSHLIQKQPLSKISYSFYFRSPRVICVSKWGKFVAFMFALSSNSHIYIAIHLGWTQYHVYVIFIFSFGTGSRTY